MQVRVVEACVESSLLFDCQARTWQVGEMRRLQSFMDRAYRYVWSRGNRPPLIQMQEEGVNMEDVRRALGVRSIRWKIEKRCLERIGHIMRMDDGRMVKAVTLGWMEGLEAWPKLKGKTRKTLVYWRKLVREAGLDVTKIGKMTADRGRWKELVKKRMAHLEKYEWSRGHTWQGDPLERNATKEEDFVFVCDDCGKVCKSKAGLTIQVRRMHEVSAMKQKFECECGKSFKQEANLKNHRKKCGGEEVVVEARVYKGKRGICPGCGQEMAATNIARHRKEVCDRR